MLQDNQGNATYNKEVLGNGHWREINVSKAWVMGMKNSLVVCYWILMGMIGALCMLVARYSAQMKLENIGNPLNFMLHVDSDTHMPLFCDLDWKNIYFMLVFL